MSLVAGLVFFVVRAGLALIEPVALRYPIKKWSAIAALAATALYLGLSGLAVPTLRAFLMTSIALTAVLLDRSPFSMRLVAVAAGILLLAQPDSMLGASFQMSFAAVVALIAFFEEWSDRGDRSHEKNAVQKAPTCLVSLHRRSPTVRHADRRVREHLGHEREPVPRRPVPAHAQQRPRARHDAPFRPRRREPGACVEHPPERTQLLADRDHAAARDRR
jgi:ComEC/Rec2-related protein